MQNTPIPQNSPLDSGPTSTTGTREHRSLDQPYPRPRLILTLAGGGGRGRDKNTTEGLPQHSRKGSWALPGAPFWASEFLAPPLYHLILLLRPQVMGRKQEGQASCPRSRHLPIGVRTVSPSRPTQRQRVWQQRTLSSLTGIPHSMWGSPRFSAAWAWEAPVLELLASRPTGLSPAPRTRLSHTPSGCLSQAEDD